ncbi:MAG: hypothetical protein HQL44_05185 [Alphaproteobacteria bacterium]|nr:hypothetical protein [Alphaproteobacteria bacterium]
MWFEGSRNYVQGAVMASQAIELLGLSSFGSNVKVRHVKFPQEVVCDGFFILLKDDGADELAVNSSMVMALNVDGTGYSALFLPDPSTPIHERRTGEFGQSLLCGVMAQSPYTGTAEACGLSKGWHLFSALVAANKAIHQETVPGIGAIRLGFIAGLRVPMDNDVVDRTFSISVLGHEIKREGGTATSIAELSYQTDKDRESASMCFVFTV